MPPKKAKSPTGAGSIKKKVDIADVPVNEDWKVSIHFLVENEITDIEHTKVLFQSVRVPLRRKFSIITYDDLMEKVLEYGDPKGKKPADSPPPFIDVCETIFAMQEKSEEITLQMWARLIKFGILSLKATHCVITSNSTKESTTTGKQSKKGKASGKKSGKKIASSKEDPKSGKDWSTLKKRSEMGDTHTYIDDEPKDGPSHYILISGFHNAQLLPILEDMMVFVNGVIKIKSESYDEVQALLDKPKPPFMLMQQPAVTEEDLEIAAKKKADDAKNLELFWGLLPHVFDRYKMGSKLQNVATLQLNVPNDILPCDWHLFNKMMAFGEKLFDLLAGLIYETVDNLRQYETFMRNMHVINVPHYSEQRRSGRRLMSDNDSNNDASPVPGSAPGQRKKDSLVPGGSADHDADSIEASHKPAVCSYQLDMRYYNDLMDSVPMEAVSVPIVLHSMIEQVAATEEGKLAASEERSATRRDDGGLDASLATHIASALAHINLAPDDEKVLVGDFPKMAESAALGGERKKCPSSSSKGPVVINYHDDIKARTHNLDKLTTIDPVQVEKKMLRCSLASRIVAECEPVSAIANERSARLHELIRHTTAVNEDDNAGNPPTSALMDRGFRQFVFESMSLSHLDKHGYVVPGGGANRSQQTDNFWDDPYETIIREATNAVANGGKTIDGEMIDDLIQSDQRVSQAEAHAIRSRLLDKGASQQEMLYQAISTHNQLSPRRFFDRYVYSEHLSNKVLIQVLEETRHMYPCMDTYHHKRDDSLLVVFHHPISDQLDAKTKWFSSLYSDVGFRNYRDHIAAGIEDWTLEQDAEYEKARHAEELRRKLEEQQKLDNQPPPTPPATSRKSGKGSKKDKGKDSRKVSKKESGADAAAAHEPTPDGANPFHLPGSLKAEDEQKAREAADPHADPSGKDGKDRKSRSSKKSGKKSGKGGKSRDSAKSGRSSPSRSRKSSAKRRLKSGTRSSGSGSFRDNLSLSNKQESAPAPPKKLPFSGYNVGNEMAQVGGEETFVYPSDGGVVSAQRFKYEHGRNYVRVRVCKDGHVITCHVIEPKDHEADGRLERLLEQRKRIEICETEAATTATAEADATSRSEDANSEQRRFGSMGSVTSSDAPDRAFESDCHAEFGSTCAVFSDRMSVAFSAHGPAGSCSYASKIKLKIARLLASIEPQQPQQDNATASGKEDQQQQQQQQDGGTGSKKSKKSPRSSSRSKSPRSRKLSRDDDAFVDEIQEGLRRKHSEEACETRRKQHGKTHYPQLFLSCPDGLALCYNLNPTLNTQTGECELMPSVRQYYPIKTRKHTSERAALVDEASRLVLSDGSVVKLMLDGSTRVLCADGTVHQHKQIEVAGGGNTVTTPRVTCANMEHEETHQQQHQEIIAASSPTPPSTATGKRGGKKSAKSAKADSDRRTSAGSDSHRLLKADTEIDLSRCWQTTKITGEVYLVKDNGCSFPHKRRVCYTAVDPVTGETMYSLEDKVVRVDRKDGSVVCDHEDGTRITRFPATNAEGEVGWYVRVECTGFATITFDERTRESLTNFGSGSALSVSRDGNYKMSHWSGGELVFTSDGAAIYHPRPHDHHDDDDDCEEEGKGRGEEEVTLTGDEMDAPHEECAYVLRHNAPVAFETIDTDGNLFQIRNTGHISMFTCHQQQQDDEDEEESGDESALASPSKQQQRDPRQAYISKYRRHPPRLFVVGKDGSGCELLRDADLRDYIVSSENDPLTAVIREAMIGNSGAVGLTILRPMHNDIGDGWKLDKFESDIIPSNITTRDLKAYEFRKLPEESESGGFGKRVGKGLAIGSVPPSKGPPPVIRCPDVVEIRQVIRYPEISLGVRELLRKKFIEYVRDLGMEEVRRQSLQVKDPRAESEVQRASDLLTLVLEYDDRLKNRSPQPNQSSNHQQRGVESPIVARTVTVQGGSGAGGQKLTSASPSTVRREYEANIRNTKTPPQPRKAQPVLSKEDWELIRAEILEERLDRDALARHQVPPYFLSEEGRAWLATQAQVLARMSDAIDHDKQKQRAAMQVSLASKDHHVFVGKRPVNKINVSTSGVEEFNQLPIKNRAKPVSNVYEMADNRPNNPTPQKASQNNNNNNAGLRKPAVDPKHKSFLQQIEDSYSQESERLDSGGVDSTNHGGNTTTTESYPSDQRIDTTLDDDDEATRAKINYASFTVDNWPQQQQNPAPDILVSRKKKKTAATEGGEFVKGKSGKVKLPVRGFDSKEHILSDFYRDETRVRNLARSLADQPTVNFCHAMEPESGIVMGDAMDASALLAKSLLHYKPDAKLNKKFIEVEEPVRRHIKVSSIAGPLNKGRVNVLRRGFELIPNQIDMGVLKEGERYSYTARLKNIGIDSCRYKIKQPPHGSGLSVHFAPRLVAAGMEVPVRVEVFAIAEELEEDGGIGKLRHNLEIVAETEIFHLPITATVLTEYQFAQVYGDDMQQAVLQLEPGVTHHHDRHYIRDRSAACGDMV